MEIWPSLYIFISLIGVCMSRKNDRGGGFLINWRLFEPDNIEKTSANLSTLMKTKCEPSKIIVTFELRSMKRLGILPNQISLKDSQCTAKVNSTHYLLHIDFNSNRLCSSDLVNSGRSIKNYVVVRPPDPRSQFTNYREQLVDQEDDIDVDGSGSGEEVIITTDNTEISTINLPFLCSYRSSVTPNQSPTLPIRTTESSTPGLSYPVLPVYDDTFTLQFYTGSGYLNEYKPSVPRIYKSTTMYGQISSRRYSTEYDSFRIYSCYLSDIQKSTVDDKLSNRYYLIRNGCELDDVSMTDSTGNSRFTFNMKRAFRTFTFIHCEVEPCSNSLNGKYRQCIRQSEYCNSQTQPTHLYSTSWYHTFTVVKKPKIIIPGDVPKIPVDCPVYKEPECDCPVQASAPEIDKSTQEILKDEEQDKLSVSIVIIIAVIAFCSGAGLVVILWVVHVRTDPRRHMLPVSTSDDGSSQNSRTPIKVDQTDSMESQKIPAIKLKT